MEVKEDGDVVGGDFVLSGVERLNGPARCLASYDQQGVAACTSNGECAWIANGQQPRLVLGGMRLHGIQPGFMFVVVVHRLNERNTPCFARVGADHKAGGFHCR